MATVDIHQHIWPEQLVSELERRDRPPRLRGATLELPRQGSFQVDVSQYSLDARLRALDRDEIDVAVVSLAPTLELGDLPSEEAEPLLEAYHDGIRELAEHASGRIEPLACDRVLDGFAGTSVAAERLRDLDTLSPLLEQLSSAGGFLFVHPGPCDPPPRAPSWWGAVVDYSAQLEAAYAAWLAVGAARWPDLPVVFALLAGGAPFQIERMRSRGFDIRTAPLSNVYLETASYARRAIELCLSTFGVRQLLYGSDAPVVESQPTLNAVRAFGQAVEDALCRENPSRLLLT